MSALHHEHALEFLQYILDATLTGISCCGNCNIDVVDQLAKEIANCHGDPIIMIVEKSHIDSLKVNEAKETQEILVMIGEVY